jgi:hypothetical protein
MPKGSSRHKSISSRHPRGLSRHKIDLKSAQNRQLGTEIPNVFNACVKTVPPGGGICRSKERIFTLSACPEQNQAVPKKALELRPVKKIQFLALAKD